MTVTNIITLRKSKQSCVSTQRHFTQMDTVGFVSSNSCIKHLLGVIYYLVYAQLLWNQQDCYLVDDLEKCTCRASTYAH